MSEEVKKTVAEQYANTKKAVTEAKNVTVESVTGLLDAGTKIISQTKSTGLELIDTATPAFLVAAAVEVFGKVDLGIMEGLKQIQGTFDISPNTSLLAVVAIASGWLYKKFKK